MDANGPRGAQVGAHLQRLGHVEMHHLHEPARRIGADRDERHVETAETLADVAEILRVAGVAGVNDAQPLAFHHPAAPQRGIRVSERSAAPMLHRHERDPHLPFLGRLPPVVFVNALNTAFDKPRLQPQRHQKARAAGGQRGELKHGFFVEVVVVVVRNHHDVDVRQLRHFDRQRHQALRAGKRDRAGALGEVRVEQHRLPGNAQQHRRVADPGHRGVGRAGAQQFRIGRYGGQVPALGRWLGKAIAQPLPLPRPEARFRSMRIVVLVALGSRLARSNCGLRSGCPMARQHTERQDANQQDMTHGGCEV